MSHAGNGQPVVHQISISAKLGQQVKLLHKQAKLAGLGVAYVEAFRYAIFRMQHDPWGFGELVSHLKHARCMVHVRVVKPLLIEFAIHEDRPIVFIKRIQLMI